MKTLISMIQLTFAVLISRMITFGLRLFKGGSATSLPGLVVNQLMPSILEKLVTQIPHVIVITGTNGKTTTQKILSSIISFEHEARVINNASGSNMIQGLVTTLLKRASLFGGLDFTHAILEVEEGTLPRIVQKLKPEIIAVTNLFRDQLDAYGEVDITRKYIRAAIEKSPEAKIVLNSDDPIASALTFGLSNKTYFVSLPQQFSSKIRYESSSHAEAATSPQYDFISAAEIKINKDLSTSFKVHGSVDGKSIQFADHPLGVSAPGYFQIYNALTAILIAKILGLANDKVKKGLDSFKPAFGRGEEIIIKRGSKSVTYKLLLAKNPAGINANLDTLSLVKNPNLLILLNDLTADGKDVSWIWDGRFEDISQMDYNWITLSGIRGRDLAVRLKYALDAKNKDIFLAETIKSAIDQTFAKAENKEIIYVLTTYTAMLKFRSILGKKIE